MTDQGVTRKLTAIMSADVKGYSRLMADDEAATVKCLTAHRQIISRLVDLHHGRVIDSPGDNVLAEFASAVNAVQCAVEVQEELQGQNAELPEHRRMEWRIGINLGDVIAEGERIYGDGVNVAARIESIAEPGGICVSRNIYDQVKYRLFLYYEYLGEHAVKNITEPVRIYRVRPHPATEARRIKQARRWFGSKWRKVAAAVAVILIVAAAVAITRHSFWSRSRKSPAVRVQALPLPDRPSVAVLPFVNTSGDPRQDFLSDGITDQIIYALSRVPGLFVIARQSSFFYKGKKVKVQQVGRELGVRYVVEGSVHRKGDRLRITAQLIDARTGRHLWAERYDRKLKDIFALQDAITLKIISAVGARLTQGERVRLLAKGTSNVEALLSVMKGYAIFYQATAAAIDKARQLARRAIRLDPKYPDAYCLLGVSYFMQAHYAPYKARQQYWRESAQAYKKALAIDKHHSDALAYLGYVYVYGFRRWDKALDLAKRAVKSGPGNADAYLFKGVILYTLDRPHEAVSEIIKAIRMNPKPPAWYYMFLGFAYLTAGQCNKAIPVLNKAHALAPNIAGIHWGLAICYYLTGRKGDARKQFARWRKLQPVYSLETWTERCIVKNKKYCIGKANIMRKLGLK
jgi:TolB-like protein/class 3 adenylate cyclase/Flp pilus assembly protein TadD